MIQPAQVLIAIGFVIAAFTLSLSLALYMSEAGQRSCEENKGRWLMSSMD
jgi:hypothetical protein